MDNFVDNIGFLKFLPIPAVFCKINEEKSSLNIKYINNSMSNILEEYGYGNASKYADLQEILKLDLKKIASNSEYGYINNLNSWFKISSQAINEEEAIFYFDPIDINNSLFGDEFDSKGSYVDFIMDSFEQFYNYIISMKDTSIEYDDIMEQLLVFIDENDVLKEDIDENIKLNKMVEFSFMLHELITPVNILNSSIQLMEKKEREINLDDKFIGDNLSIMKTNINRMLYLINNIIDFTKFKSGYNDFNPEIGNIVDFAKNQLDSIAQLANEKSIELIFETDFEEINLLYDKEKMERLFLNLLSNSIKYNNDKGFIKINLSKEKSNLIIKIVDSGIGISEENIKNVFEKFEKENTIRNISIKGKGIGLAIVKDIVDMHKGDIGLKSKVDVGTECTIKLPI